nr:hypothetical protein [Kibdelosporangium sp. MJ126-NF4]
MIMTQDHDHERTELPELLTGVFAADLRVRGFEELGGSIAARESRQDAKADRMSRRARDLLARADHIDALTREYWIARKKVEYWEAVDVDQMVKEVIGEVLRELDWPQ